MSYSRSLSLTSFVIAMAVCTSCEKNTTTSVTPAVIPVAEEQSYSVCTIDPIPEADFSEWCAITDMHLAYKAKSKDTYWVHLEGRNNGGLSEFRWIERAWPKEKYTWWQQSSNMTPEEFLKRGLELRSQGYQRASLQVFVDASGVARHQALWVKPAENSTTVDQAVESLKVSSQ